MSAQTHIPYMQRLATIASQRGASGKAAVAFSYTEKGAGYDPVLHQATFIISDMTVDRDKDVLFPDGVDLTDYEKNPVVLYQHDSHGPSLPVGHAVRTWVEDGKVKSTVQFNQDNEDAVAIEKSVAAGDLRACSVGFIGIQVADNSNRPTRWGGFGKDVLKWTLLEWSIVKVPSNPNAVLDRKAFEAFLEHSMSTLSLTPAPAADPSTKSPVGDPNQGDTAAGLLGQIAQAHKDAQGMLKDCKDMLKAHKDTLLAHKDSFDAYQKAHKDMTAVHAGLVEDHKANNKAHKDACDAMGAHVGSLKDCVAAMKDAMGVATAVGATQAAATVELTKKLGEQEAILKDPAASIESKLAAAAEIPKIQKMIRKAGKVISGAHRDLLTKASAKMDEAKGHIAQIVKAADDAEADDDGDDDEDDQDKAGDTDAVKAEKKSRREKKATARAEKKAAAERAEAEAWYADVHARAAAGDAEAIKLKSEFEAASAKVAEAELLRAKGKTNFAA